MDKLQLMVERQRALQVAFGVHFDTMTDEERIEYIRYCVLALENELHEMLGEIGWKPWAKSKHINVNAAFAELVDAWHFMMNLMLAIMPGSMHSHDVADRLSAYYHYKSDVNEQRQRSGYDGVSTKCPQCSRALDDFGAIDMEERSDGHMWHLCSGCGLELDAHFESRQIERLRATVTNR